MISRTKFAKTLVPSLAAVALIATACTSNQATPTATVPAQASPTDTPVATATVQATAVSSPTAVVTQAPTATVTSQSPTPTPTAAAQPAPTAEAFFLKVTTPQDQSLVQTSTIEVKGTTTPDAVVTVNGSLVSVNADGAFDAPVTLQEGPNTVQVTASNVSGAEQDQVLTVTYVPQG